MNFEQELRDAVDDRALVRIVRGDFEASCPEIEGLVLACSDALVCVAVLDDRVRFNGIDIFYCSQITEFESPAPHAAFYEAALRLRGDQPPQPPPVDLSTMQAVLTSVSEIAPLIVIHREVEEPEVCEIGQATGFDAEAFRLREIDPDAEWEQSTSEYRYDEVTRMSYGGDYEAALALVAGVVL